MQPAGGGTPKPADSEKCHVNPLSLRLLQPTDGDRHAQGRQRGSLHQMPQRAGGARAENQAGAAATQPRAGLSKPHTASENVFERNDFGNLFEQQVPSRSQAPQPPLFTESSAQAPTPSPPLASFIEYEAIPVNTQARSGHGIHIPAALLAAACAAIVVLLGLAFLLGLLVGRSAN